MRALLLPILAVSFQLALAVAPTSAERPGDLPDLAIEGPAELEPLARLLETVAEAQTARAMDLLGIVDAGPPIRVILAPEGTSAAQRAPSWASAYAIGSAGLVVLLPDRIPAYPDRSLEEVLVHEVAHVLVARAAGRRPVPRWFDEGLALQVARPWSIDDQARLWKVSLGGLPPTLDSLDERFRGGQASAASAYALSGAFVRFLMDEVDEAAPARILHEVALGRGFDEAFRRATGRRLEDFESGFRASLEPARLWLPIFTHPTTLWVGISLLALAAGWRARQRKREREEAWEAEEAAIRELLERERRAAERFRLVPRGPEDEPAN